MFQVTNKPRFFREHPRHHSQAAPVETPPAPVEVKPELPVITSADVACITLIKYPDMSDADIAKSVNCTVRNLYKNERYRKLRETQKSERREYRLRQLTNQREGFSSLNKELASGGLLRSYTLAKARNLKKMMRKRYVQEEKLICPIPRTKKKTAPYFNTTCKVCGMDAAESPYRDLCLACGEDKKASSSILKTK